MWQQVPFCNARLLLIRALLLALCLCGHGLLGQEAHPLTVGLRASWHGGDSKLQGARLMRDPLGNIWFEGDWYSLTTVRGSGGVGYSQLQVLAHEKGKILADIRHHPKSLLVDDCYLLGTQDACQGTDEGLGDFWIDPKILRQQKEHRDQGGHAILGEREFQGERRETLSLVERRSGAYSSKTYDLKTGFLLFRGSMDIDPSLLIKDDQKSAIEEHAGRGQYSHLLFVGTRQLQIPWVKEALPAWMKSGGEAVYRGGNSQFQFRFQGRIGRAHRTAQEVMTSPGPGLPALTTHKERAFGVAMHDGLFIPPAHLQRLRPGQILDRDPVTGREVLVGTPYEGKLPIATRSPSDLMEQFYDLQSGAMVYARYSQTVPNVGQSVSDLHLVHIR